MLRTKQVISDYKKGVFDNCPFISEITIKIRKKFGWATHNKSKFTCRFLHNIDGKRKNAEEKPRRHKETTKMSSLLKFIT